MATLQNYTNDRTVDSKKFQQGGSDVIDGAKTMMGSGAAMAGHIRDDAVDLTNAAISDVKSFVGPYVDRMEREVKTYPVQSVAIAFGIGALLSFLLRRV
jgi:ElaB/YqjD/DUF883 family membrane-anchored ribosome-binding protein